MEDIHTIKSPIETSILTKTLVHSLWVFLTVVAILLFLFYYFFTKRKNIKQAEIILQKEQREIEIDYKKNATEKLKEAQKHMELLEYKIFYLKASEIIKEYLGRVCDENFLDMTTREVLNYQKLPTKINIDIEKFLKLTDLSKFAGKNQEKEIARHILELAFLIIE